MGIYWCYLFLNLRLSHGRLGFCNAFVVAAYASPLEARNGCSPVEAARPCCHCCPWWCSVAPHVINGLLIPWSFNFHWFLRTDYVCPQGKLWEMVTGTLVKCFGKYDVEPCWPFFFWQPVDFSFLWFLESADTAVWNIVATLGQCQQMNFPVLFVYLYKNFHSSQSVFL